MREAGDSWIKHEYKEITFYIILGILMTIILPLFLGFVLKGFEESFIEGKPLEFGTFLVTYIIYYIMIIASLIGLPVLKLREMLLTNKGENVAEQSHPSPMAVAYLHDPEVDGAFYNLFSYLGLKGNKNPMRWSLSIFRCIIIATIIFGGIGILQTAFGSGFSTGIKQLIFQITPTVSILFTAEPASFAETTILILVFSLLMGLNAWLVSKYKLPVLVYWTIGLLIICPFIGAAWMGFHNLVYGHSAVSLFTSFLFGWLGSTITLITGSFIFWYVWHFWNNVFFKIHEIAPSNQDVIFISVVIWLALLIIYVGAEIWLYRYRKKSQPIEFQSEPKKF